MYSSTAHPLMIMVSSFQLAREQVTLQQQRIRVFSETWLLLWAQVSDEAVGVSVLFWAVLCQVLLWNAFGVSITIRVDLVTLTSVLLSMSSFRMASAAKYMCFPCGRCSSPNPYSSSLESRSCILRYCHKQRRRMLQFLQLLKRAVPSLNLKPPLKTVI